jgi:hypothetical protein
MPKQELEEICQLLGCQVLRDKNYARHLRTHLVENRYHRKTKFIGGKYPCIAHKFPMHFKTLRDLNIHTYLFHRHQDK